MMLFPYVQFHKNQWADTELLQALVHFYLLTQTDQSSLCSFAYFPSCETAKIPAVVFLFELGIRW